MSYAKDVKLPSQYKKGNYNINNGDTRIEYILEKHEAHAASIRCLYRSTYDMIMEKHALSKTDISGAFIKYQSECNDLMYTLGSKISLIELDTNIETHRSLIKEKAFQMLRTYSFSSREFMIKEPYYKHIHRYIATLEKYIQDNNLMEQYKDQK